VDSYYNTPDLGEPEFEVTRHVARTERDYQRYEITDDGISPRGIPGFGTGIVVLDSDEHDEGGHITESMEVRVQMVDKRLRKLNLLLAEVIPPELIGPENYETLVVAWGSNYHVVREALKVLGRDNVAGLYFRQVYPLHPDTAAYLKRARQTVTVENNATGQFASVIEQQTGIEIAEKVLKYDGMPFSVEGLVDQLGKLSDGSQ